MKKRSRSILAMVATLLCALLILGAGYAGIALGGEEMLKISQEPEKIDLSEDISNLFYSRIEDDVQLRPWNYYTQENDHDGDVSAEEELYGMVESLYMLIAVAADVEGQEVIRWFSSQDKTILKDVVARYVEEEDAYYFFYDDVIRLNGREYHVKFCSDSQNMYSFSCLRPKEENVRDSEQWSENKEWLSGILNQNNWLVEEMYGQMETAHWNNLDAWDWYVDVELYLMLYEYFCAFEQEKEDMIYFYPEDAVVEKVRAANDKAVTDAESAEVKIEEAEESPDFKLQMVELDDCILLMSEEYQSLAIYYDVMEKRVVGFHFFY